MTTRPDDVTVELLYVDRERCDRCRRTEAAVEGALAALRPALALAGVGVVLDRRRVDSAATARRLGFEVSPTVRVDDRDLQPEFETSDCDCVVGRVVPCRVWAYRGRKHDSAPPGLIADAVLGAADGGWPDTDSTTASGTGPASAPVDAYFDGPDTASDGADGDGCC